MTTQDQIAKYISDRVDVVVIETTERGCHEWAVAVASDDTFWLDAFPKLQDAYGFCKKHRLHVRFTELMTGSAR